MPHPHPLSPQPRPAAADTAAYAAPSSDSDGGDEDVADGTQCVVCWRKVEKMVAQPCGHSFACRACVHKLIETGHARCSICRRNVREYRPPADSTAADQSAIAVDIVDQNQLMRELREEARLNEGVVGRWLLHAQLVLHHFYARWNVHETLLLIAFTAGALSWAALVVLPLSADYIHAVISKEEADKIFNTAWVPITIAAGAVLALILAEWILIFVEWLDELRAAYLVWKHNGYRRAKRFITEAAVTLFVLIMLGVVSGFIVYGGLNLDEVRASLHHKPSNQTTTRARYHQDRRRSAASETPPPRIVLQRVHVVGGKPTGKVEYYAWTPMPRPTMVPPRHYRDGQPRFNDDLRSADGNAEAAPRREL